MLSTTYSPRVSLDRTRGSSDMVTSNAEMYRQLYATAGYHERLESSRIGRRLGLLSTMKMSAIIYISPLSADRNTM